MAPVVTAGSTSRGLYLPAGALLTELHTGEVLPGGRRVVAQAPLAVVPVFARDGSHPELVGQL